MISEIIHIIQSFKLNFKMKTYLLGLSAFFHIFLILLFPTHEKEGLNRITSSD